MERSVSNPYRLEVGEGGGEKEGRMQKDKEKAERSGYFGCWRSE